MHKELPYNGTKWKQNKKVASLGFGTKHIIEGIPGRVGFLECCTSFCYPVCVLLFLLGLLLLHGSSRATCQNELYIYNDNEAIFMFNNFVSALKVNSMIFLYNIFFILFLTIYELHKNSHHLYFPRCYLLSFTLEQQNQEVRWRTMNILWLFRNRSLTHE